MAEELTLACAAPPRSYEDNFDAVNTMFVLVKPAEKSKMEVRCGRAQAAQAQPLCTPLRAARTVLTD